MQEWKTLFDKARTFFTGKKRTSLVLGIGILGILCIVLSEMIPDKTTSAFSEEVTTAEYTQALEEKLTRMVRQIQGTGEVLVTVTVETGRESVYASDYAQSQDSREEDGANGQSRQQTWESEESILLLGSGSGQQALIRTYREPQIGGVVVVCEGGDDVKIQAKVTTAVSTVLGISANRVYVTR